MAEFITWNNILWLFVGAAWKTEPKCLPYSFIEILTFDMGVVLL